MMHHLRAVLPLAVSLMGMLGHLAALEIHMTGDELTIDGHPVGLWSSHEYIRTIIPGSSQFMEQGEKGDLVRFDDSGVDVGWTYEDKGGPRDCFSLQISVDGPAGRRLTQKPFSGRIKIDGNQLSLSSSPVELEALGLDKSITDAGVVYYGGGSGEMMTLFVWMKGERVESIDLIIGGQYIPPEEDWLP